MAIKGGLSNTRIRIAVGCGLAGLFCWQIAGGSGEPGSPIVRSRGVLPPAVALASPTPSAEISYDDLARRNPLGLLQTALRRYQNSVTDYTCLFTKQERIRGTLGPEQEIQVRCRELPFSVLMEWVKNPGDAHRVLYIQGQWQDQDGDPLAKIEPQGAIARLLVKSVMLPINGPSAKAASRRTVNQFGFANALKLIIEHAQAAIRDGQGSLSYVGEGEITGRRTWILRRVLPYTGDNGRWPDRILVVHLDQEWLLPISCFTYADDAQQTLLAKYVFTDVQLNAGLSAADFDAQANGF